MKEERIRVLDLLERQAITTEEAIKLLEALSNTSAASEPHDKHSFHFSSDDMQDKLSKLAQNVESFAKDVGDKISALAKEVEPTAKKFGKTVAEKTAQAVDELSKALNKAVECPEEQDCGCCCNGQETECKEDIDNVEGTENAAPEVNEDDVPHKN